MNRLRLTLLLIVFSCAAFAQKQDSDIAIIPQPVSAVRTSGEFILPRQVTIQSNGGAEVRTAIAKLSQRLSSNAGSTVNVISAKPATIVLQVNKDSDKVLGAEGYKLVVTPKNIMISANSGAGIFYGIQSLLQLMPGEIESAVPVKNISWKIPCVTVTDYPRFAWRGLMFDISRHFFGKEDIKSFIDQMVRYKFNLLHLHLSDDEGWRIEIKSLPNLTKVGAFNVKKTGYFGSFSPPAPDEPRNYGGFLTQEDVKELVAYAHDRFVNILPEIDVPGHSLAAVVSYPELSCTPGADTYKVRSGEAIMDWSHGAPPIALVDNTLCPANEKVYDFLDKVITELAGLFPFPYIHLGGDECPKNYWEKSAAVTALMQKEHLKNYEEVQSYFEKRLEKIVESKGKKFMGWDEILEGGLAPGAIVMSWRGMKGGIEAAKMGHEVVMSPTTYAYLDYMQGDSILEPRVYATLRLSKAYQFDPMPDGVDPRLIKGGQANLWTEQVYNMRHAEYMIWPRGWAIAEVLWTPKEKRSWNNFFGRVEQHFKRSDLSGIKYAPSVYDPSIYAYRENNELKVELTTEAQNLDIHYSFDNSYPDQFYPKYVSALIPPKDAYQLRMITYEGDKPVGRMMTITIAELNKRASKPVKP